MNIEYADDVALQHISMPTDSVITKKSRMDDKIIVKK
jgi:hypothetical protein